MRINNELITHIKENLKHNLRLRPNEVGLLSQGLIPLELREDNFKKIEDCKRGQDTNEEYIKYIAIDGGNSSVIETNSFVLDFIKVTIVIFSEKKTKSIKTYSGFISATYAKDKKDQNLIVRCKVINYKGNLNRYCAENLEFESSKPSPNELKETINLIRKDIEYKILSDLCSKKQNSVILRDGSLINTVNQAFFDEELTKKIYNNARTNSNIVIGVSKDSLIYTNYGNHLTSLLYLIAKENREINRNPWLIQVGETIKEPKIGVFVTQLNSKAKICFRVDSFIDNSTESFTLLTRISTDPTFLGYPYPLIVADRFARVSNEEVRLIKEVIDRSIKASDLAKLENFFNSHKFLDSIR